MWWILWRACCPRSSPSCATPVLIQEQELLRGARVCPPCTVPPSWTTGPGRTGSQRSSRASWVPASVCSARTRGWWSALTKRPWKWVDSRDVIYHRSCLWAYTATTFCSLIRLCHKTKCIWRTFSILHKLKNTKINSNRKLETIRSYSVLHQINYIIYQQKNKFLIKWNCEEQADLSVL